MNVLNETRVPKEKYKLKTNVLIAAGILVFGIVMGVFSKYLDISYENLPVFLDSLDDLLNLHVFFDGFSPWVVLGLGICIYSPRPFNAAVNIYVFFCSFLASYYIYGISTVNEWPAGYSLVVWGGLAILSPLIGYFCWYAKGDGVLAIIVSSGFIGFLMNTTFDYGFWYFEVKSLMEVFMLVLGIYILRRNVRESLFIVCFAVPFGIFMKMVIPFGIW